jgi:hypothetical protein
MNLKQKHFFLLLTMLAICTLLPVCKKPVQNTASEGVAGGTQSLEDSIARLTPKDWTLAETADTFSAENLYERINGRAELYLSYDVVSLTTATFERGENSLEYIELSVYDMGTPVNGFGIFSVERFPGDPPLDLGRLSYQSDASVYVWKGQFYIVVIASDFTEQLSQLSLEIAQQAVAFLSDEGEPVWGLSAFPQENLIQDSIQYFNADALGLEFMGQTYTAKYRHGDKEIMALLSRKKSEEAATKTVSLYAKYSEQYGNGFKDQAINGTPGILCDMRGVFDILFHKGKIVCGILSVDDPATAYASALKLTKIKADKN